MKRTFYVYLALLLTLIVSPTQADYMFEFGPVFTKSDRKTQLDISAESLASPFISVYGSSVSNTEEKSLGAFFTVYYDRVSTSGIPLAEAGFLSKTGKFTAQLESSAEDSDAGFVIRDQFDNIISSNSTSASQDGATLDLYSEFVTRGVPFIFGFGTRFEAYEDDDSFDIDTEILTLKAKLGLFITDNGRLTFQYDDIDVETDVSDTNGERKNLTYRHVIPMGGAHHLAVGVSSTRSEFDGSDETRVNKLGLTYYPLSQFSVGFSWSVIDDSNDDLDSYGFFSELFITEQVSLRLNVSQIDSSETEVDTSSPIAVFTEREKTESDHASIQLKIRI